VKVVAIVPARGGSKGLPGKNIRPLAGKPLIAHSIIAALGCPLIQRCIVSTDDPEIKARSLEWGAEVIDRPAAFAADASPTQAAVRHVLTSLDELPEYFVLLQPTSPLRNSRHLTACLEAFFASDAACTISVTETEHHPYKSHTLEGGRLRPLFGAENLHRPRQALPKVLRENGAIYAMKSALFLERDSFYAEPALAYEMPNEASVDIDTFQDFLRAESLLGEAPESI